MSDDDDDGSDDVFIDTVKKLKSYEKKSKDFIATSRSCPGKKIKQKYYDYEQNPRAHGLPHLQCNFQISGTKVLPESLAYIHASHLDDFKAKEKDYKTLPIDHRSATKFSPLNRKPRFIYDNSPPNITKKFIEMQKRECKQIEKENESYMSQGVIPQWASVGICTTTNNYQPKGKVNVRSKYAKVMAI